jgi:hypothetical protein
VTTIEKIPSREAVPPSELWKNVLGETFLITIVGAVLYFWGILYYIQLTASLGLGISMFSISVYEVIVAPWDSAVIVAGYCALLWFIWHQRHLIEWVLYYGVLISALIVRWLFRLLTTKAARTRMAQCLRVIGKWIQANFPPALRPPASLIASLNDPEKDRRMIAAAFHAGIVLAIVGIGLGMPAKARNRVENYAASNDKALVEALCIDGTVVSGNYVLALGDAVVIDTQDAGQPRRVLLKQSQLKRFDKLLPAKSVTVGKTQPTASTTAAAQ